MTRKEYQQSKPIINDKRIRLGNHAIMDIREKPFIQKQAKNILKEFKPNSVLEIGYGLGLTAEIFKEVDRHLIIEAHPILAQIAKDKGYTVWEGFAQDFETDEEFDIIYDDRYEVLEEECNLKDKVKHNKYMEFKLCKQ